MNSKNIPAKMTACVLTKPGEFEIQKDVPVPSILGPGEVLCRVRAVAICGSDPEIIRGGLAGEWPPAYPFIAGHEWAGEVVKVGEGVAKVKVGDRVAGEAHKGCGYCRNCMQGRYNICLNYAKLETGHEHYGFIVNGAYCQYQRYNQRSLTVMPPSVSFAEASMCDTTGVALHGLLLAGITAGGTSVIIGPGPIGLSAMKEAKALGSSRVIMVGRGARLEAAKRMGADECVDINAVEPIKAVRDLTGGVGPDEAFECSGAKGTFHQAVRMVKKGGHIALIGVATADVMEEIPFKYVTHNELGIFGSRANANVSQKVMNMMASGQLQVKDLISHRFPLEDFAKALDTFVKRKENVVKVVIQPNGAE